MAFSFELGAGIQNCRVFHATGNDVATGLAPRDAEDCQVVSFGAAARKDDFPRVTLESCGQRPTCAFEVPLRRLAIIVDAGGVAIHFGHRLPHVFEDFRGDWRGRVVVEIIVLRQIPV